jgi:hypothetical protein
MRKGQVAGVFREALHSGLVEGGGTVHNLGEISCTASTRISNPLVKFEVVTAVAMNFLMFL